MVGDEDGFDNVTVPRLHVAGADLSLVADLPVGDDGPLVIKRDAVKLRELIKADGFKVVIFDQLLDNLGVNVDDWRSKQVRDAIAPLRRVAAETDTLMLGALHTNKSKTGTFRSRVSGTQAFNALSRSSLLVAEHPDNAELRVVARGKGNYSARPVTVAFRIDSRTIEINGHVHEIGCAAGIHDDHDIDVDDVLGTPAAPASKAATARQLIEDALADGDWHDAHPIRQACLEAGITERAIAQAATDIGTERKRSNGFPSGNLWRLARGGIPTSTTGTTSTTGNGSSASDASGDSQTHPRVPTHTTQPRSGHDHHRRPQDRRAALPRRRPRRRHRLTHPRQPHKARAGGQRTATSCASRTSSASSRLTGSTRSKQRDPLPHRLQRHHPRMRLRRDRRPPHRHMTGRYPQTSAGSRATTPEFSILQPGSTGSFTVHPGVMARGAEAL